MGTTGRMEHVAIMKKAWGLLPKIVSGSKTIESRWYESRRDPWDKVKKGDGVYFKNSGEKISVKAEVGKVMQFSSLTPLVVKKILQKYRTGYSWRSHKGINTRTFEY